MPTLLLLSSTLVNACIQLLTFQPEIGTQDTSKIALERAQHSDEVNALQEEIIKMLLQSDLTYYPAIETSTTTNHDNEKS
jgi:hypothetical protein